MRKINSVLVFFLLALAGVLSLGAQDIDVSEDVRLSIAGPQSLYLRNLSIDGQKAHVLFSYDGMKWTPERVDIATGAEFWREDEISLDFARISENESGFSLDGVLWDGSWYSLSLSYVDGAVEAKDIRPSAAVGSSLLTNGLVTGEEYDRVAAANTLLEQQLSEAQGASAEQQRLELRERQLKAQITGLRLEIDGKNSQIDELLNEIFLIEERLIESTLEVEQLKLRLSQSDEARQEAEAALAQALDANRENLSRSEVLDLAEQGADRFGTIEADLDQLSAQVTLLAARLGSMENPEFPEPVDHSEQLDRLETLIAALELTSARSEAPNGTTPGEEAVYLEPADVTEELRAIRARAESAELSLQQAARALDRVLGERGIIGVFDELDATIVVEGFTQAVVDRGSWTLSEDRSSVEQTDPNEFFARMTMPIDQGSGLMHYHFETRSSGERWVGTGLHFQGQNSELNGYGFGQSVLVWLTRDPDAYNDNNTYLQIYRSDDDVNMERIADSVVEERLDQWIAVDVYYDPETRYITVALDGIEKLRYKTWFSLDDGLEVALRTLDTGSFRNFYARRIDKP